MAYFLPPHRFLCSIGQCLLVLDVHNDRYSALRGPAAERLRAQALPVKIPTPAAELRVDEHEVRIRPDDVLLFLWACLKARWMLRFWRFERIVTRVRSRRAGAGTESSVELARAWRLIAVAERLRPFMLTAREACLLDSLALSEFLAHHRLFAAWVFAVRMGPFNAHCWLQYGDVLLNETLENTRPFTPIMVV